jgi:DNA repair exonuclease SbcCD ATPase subunit
MVMNQSVILSGACLGIQRYGDDRGWIGHAMRQGQGVGADIGGGLALEALHPAMAAAALRADMQERARLRVRSGADQDGPSTAEHLAAFRAEAHIEGHVRAFHSSAERLTAAVLATGGAPAEYDSRSAAVVGAVAPVDPPPGSSDPRESLEQDRLRLQQGQRKLAAAQQKILLEGHPAEEAISARKQQHELQRQQAALALEQTQLNAARAQLHTEQRELAVERDRQQSQTQLQSEQSEQASFKAKLEQARLEAQRQLAEERRSLEPSEPSGHAARAQLANETAQLQAARFAPSRCSLGI